MLGLNYLNMTMFKCYMWNTDFRMYKLSKRFDW